MPQVLGFVRCQFKRRELDQIVEQLRRDGFLTRGSLQFPGDCTCAVKGRQNRSREAAGRSDRAARFQSLFTGRTLTVPYNGYVGKVLI